MELCSLPYLITDGIFSQLSRHEILELRKLSRGTKAVADDYLMRKTRHMIIKYDEKTPFINTGLKFKFFDRVTSLEFRDASSFLYFLALHNVSYVRFFSLVNEIDNVIGTKLFSRDRLKRVKKLKLCLLNNFNEDEAPLKLSDCYSQTGQCTYFTRNFVETIDNFSNLEELYFEQPKHLKSDPCWSPRLPLAFFDKLRNIQVLTLKNVYVLRYLNFFWLKDLKLLKHLDVTVQFIPDVIDLKRNENLKTVKIETDEFLRACSANIVENENKQVTHLEFRFNGSSDELNLCHVLKQFPSLFSFKIQEKFFDRKVKKFVNQSFEKSEIKLIPSFG